MLARFALIKGRWSPVAFVLVVIAACGGRVSGSSSGLSSGGVSTGTVGGATSGTISVSSSGSTSGSITSGSFVGGSGPVGVAGTSSGMAISGMALPPCPTPTFSPPAGAIVSGSNVVITAAGLPAGGEILFTTDRTTPTRASPVYNSGAVGVQVTIGETFQAISTTMGATCTDSAVASASYTLAFTPVPEAGPLGPVPSAGCGKALTMATGMWVRQPANCDQGAAEANCQPIPVGSNPVLPPAMPKSGDPEWRGWWVYVPAGYDASRPYKVIYEHQGCFDADFFDAGRDGYPYQDVDDGQAIQVGLDYDTYSDLLGCPDVRDPTSNDLVFMPWLMNEIESSFCVDTASEWMSEYADLGSLAQQFDCAFPSKFRGQMIVTGIEPGAPGTPGSLPPCNPAPMAAFYVHDLNNPDNPYASILPGCSRVLRQNGCANTTCDPLDKILTTPYAVPTGVELPAGATCAQFNGCPAEYPVVFCVTANQSNNDGRSWGVVKLFWDFTNRLSPMLCPPGQAYQNGTCAPCPAGEAACNGFCVDEQTDPNNCGACNLVCAPPLGGGSPSCSGGVCAM